MKKNIILMISALGVMGANITTVQAKANLLVILDKGVHKMKKQKSSGDSYPINGPVVRVYGKGKSKYDSIANDNENMNFLMSVSAICNKKIRSLSAEVNGISQNVRKTSNKGKTVKKHTVLIKTPFTLPNISRTPVQACMNELNERAALTNRSKESLLKSGFVVKYENAYVAKLTGSCSAALGKGDFESKKISLPVWIMCEPIKNAQTPKSNTGTKGSGHKPKAKKAKAPKLKMVLTATPKTSEKCPAAIKFNGKITSTRKGVVKYKIVGQENKKSWSTPVKTVKFDKVGTKAISQWTHSYHKPDTSKSFATKPQGGPNATKGKAQIMIIEKPNHAAVLGGKVTYDIWCNGKPKRKKAVSRASKIQ